MLASKSLKRSPISNVIALILLAALGSVSAAWFYSHGYTLYWGDAEAHLNTARRIIDSRTPGYDQLGTPWLPLPHLLMIPFVRNDALWRSGLAGTIPSVTCFVFAGLFLFAAARRVFSDMAPAACTLALFALNPNLLYVQSIPMTEAAFFFSLCGLLYCTVAFADAQSAWLAFAAGLFSIAGCLTRYDGWWLIPFVTLYFFVTSRAHRFRNAIVFALVAGSAPVYWLCNNWYCCGDALEFYRGRYSALGIQGNATYPGNHDWKLAWIYFRTAATMVAGRPLAWIGCIGVAAALFKRALWPVVLLALPPIFYVVSMHGSGTPIFAPSLWPYGYYNTRYGLAALPLLALGGGALVAWAPLRIRGLAALVAVLAAVAPWLANPRTESWICWKESEVNSVARRAWTREAAEYFRGRYKRGDGIFTMFGDLTGVPREVGIPLREVLHDGNNPTWMAAKARPDLFLHERWALAIEGDEVSTTMKTDRRYRCVKMIHVAEKGAPVILIYRRLTLDESSLH
jgi:hypothetical protein